QSAMAVSSLQAPGGRPSAPPPAKSATGTNVPGSRSWVAVASASPTASPTSAPVKRLRIVEAAAGSLVPTAPDPTPIAPDPTPTEPCPAPAAPGTPLSAPPSAPGIGPAPAAVPRMPRTTLGFHDRTYAIWVSVSGTE